MNVLLINCPQTRDSIPAIQPYGLFYVYHALTSNGYKCSLLDIDGHGYTKEKVSAFLKENPHDVIGIGGLVTIYPYLKWLIPEIKNIYPETEIILGGAVASSLRERCFDTFDIDYEVIGEGEVTIVELMNEITTSRNFESVKSIAYKKDNGEVVFTEKRPLMENLDNLPRLDESLFPTKNYLKTLKGLYHVHVQRGCPHSCTFCFNNFRVVGNQVRYRNYKDVVNDIEFFKNKHKEKIKIFNLSGECITANKDWIINFCKEVIERKLKIKYRVNTRVNLVDDEILSWLKKSGCKVIAFGLESGSKKILKIMGKGINTEQGKKAITLSKKYIKQVKPSFMLGYLGENKETLNETVEYSKKLNCYPGIFYTTVFPGTKLYKMAVDKGLIDDETYLNRLDMLDFNKYSINLTDFPDQEAENILRKAKESIALHYSLRRPWILFSRLNDKGFGWTARKCIDISRKIFN